MSLSNMTFTREYNIRSTYHTINMYINVDLGKICCHEQKNGQMEVMYRKDHNYECWILSG
jgi:hypothetical protein